MTHRGTPQEQLGKTKNHLHNGKMKTARRHAGAAAAGMGLLAAAGILQLAARSAAGQFPSAGTAVGGYTAFGEWYAVTVYPWIVGIYGRIFGVFPFSVVEILLYAGIIWLILYTASHIRKVIIRTEPASAAAAAWFSSACLILGLLAFLYTACCGVNYYRRPFSSYLELDVRGSSVEELTALCEYLTEKVNETVDTTPYNQDWNAEGQRAMAGLGEIYPQLSGYYPRPKPLAVPWILSVQQLSGVYSPFTVEANYNRAMTAYDIPHAICHELSHLRGFMREDEANFIGYLACIGSEDPSFRYSGYLTGWVYAGNALAAQDMEVYMGLYARLNEQTRADLAANNAFWNRYEGRVAEVANQVNDTYLKINSQSDGVKSYGRMVDLMLAYYRE